jgi:hypothetical protein
MTKCYVYRYDLTGDEELVHESRNYRLARQIAKGLSGADHNHTYRLQVETYPFRFFEKGIDVTDNFKNLLLELESQVTKQCN